MSECVDIGSVERLVLPSPGPYVCSQARPVRILVIEDNKNLAQAIRLLLTQQGYGVDVAHLGQEGEELAASESYDLVILDVMLPDRDGLVVCRNLRRRKISTYILMLTALSGTSERVTGLEAGADDYLIKPFEFDELMARIRALMRRGKASETVRLEYEGLQLDLLNRQAWRDGHRIRLRSKEMALLEVLMRNADRVVDRATIAEKVWDMHYEPSSNVIDKYVSVLRKKIDEGHEHPLIHTVVGTGYRLGAADEGI
jgi:two-component system copper resistance phosphate regulon response regulator CusR